MTDDIQSPSRSSPQALLRAARLSDQIGFVLRFAQAAVWDDLAAAFEPYGLRPAHYSVLAITKAVPGCRQQEIGEALGTQRTNLVSLIDHLEERGLIQRKHHPEDRRSHALYLTAAGARCLEDLERAHAAHAHRLGAALTATERKQLLSMLRRLAGLKYDQFS